MIKIRRDTLHVAGLRDGSIRQMEAMPVHGIVENNSNTLLNPIELSYSFMKYLLFN